MTQITNAEPKATIATTKIQKQEPEDIEEEECLFHSKMWVKGSHYISLLTVEAKRTSFW